MSRNIRACWRAGLWPLNRQRIYTDPEVANFGRTTPDYQPPRLRDSLWVTPSKPEDYNDIGLQLCVVTTPSKHLPIQKLIKGGVQEITANTILKSALQAVRKHAVNQEIKARSKRFEEQKGIESRGYQEGEEEA